MSLLCKAELALARRACIKIPGTAGTQERGSAADDKCNATELGLVFA